MKNQQKHLCTTLALATLLAAFGFAGASTASAQRRATASNAETARTNPTPRAESGTVNIQTATAEELQLLPGIGPAKADAIVRHRERRAFRRIEDLMRVRGIGRATFRRLRAMLSVEGPTTYRGPPSSSARRKGAR